MSFYGSRQFPSTPPTSVPSGRRPYHSSNVSSIPPINNRPHVHNSSYIKPPFYGDKNMYSLNYSPSKYSNSSSYPYKSELKPSDNSIKYKMRELQRKDDTGSLRSSRPIKSSLNAVYDSKALYSRLRNTTDHLADLSISQGMKKSSSHQNMANAEEASYYANTKSPFRSIGRTASQSKIDNNSVHSSYRSSYNIQVNKPPSIPRQRTSTSLSINHRKALPKDEDSEEIEDGYFFMGYNKQMSPLKKQLETASHRCKSPNYSINNNFIKLYSNKGLTGLQNIGNTCFMNCVLQCLSNTRPFLELTLDPPSDFLSENKSRLKGSLISAYKDLMQSMWKGANVFSPSTFKYEVSKFARLFAGYNQQDAQEFLMYLLQGLHEELNRSPNTKKAANAAQLQRALDDHSLSSLEKAKICWKHHLEMESSYIVEIFEGQLKSALTCSLCGYVSNTFDPFLGLSVPIFKTRGETSLIDCLDLFTQQEVLGENEKTTCDKCKRKQNSTKRLSIQKFPAILIIHLKRFSDGGMFRSKLSTLITFPVNKLDLHRYSDEEDTQAVYELYGVCNHSGSLGGGHYTAHAKHPYSHNWHHFNDSRVSQTSESNLVSPEAYILFYERISQ